MRKEYSRKRGRRDGCRRVPRSARKYQEVSMMQTSKISTQDICSIAIMTAITAVMAQISIPMPMGVPMTMQTFAVTLAGVGLSWMR